MYKYVNRPTHIWLNSFWLVKEKSPSVSFWQNSGWLINQNFRVALKFELLGFLPLISYLIIVHIIPKWIRQELWIILFNPDLMQVWGQYPVGASNCFSLFNNRIPLFILICILFFSKHVHNNTRRNKPVKLNIILIPVGFRFKIVSISQEVWFWNKTGISQNNIYIY